jgi:phage tail sheath gpL-like
MAISTAVDVSAVARVIGIKTEFQDMREGGIFFLPQRIAVIGQGSSAATYSTTKQRVTSEAQAGALYGYGSPIHLAVRQLLPRNGAGVGTIPVTVYPLEDSTVGGVAAAVGSVDPSGTITAAGQYRISVANIKSDIFVISVGDSVAQMCAKVVAAINAVPEMPVIATDNTTDVIVTAKWKGESGNNIKLSLVGTAVGGFACAFTQPKDGAANPSVDDALDQIGNVWETMVLNCLDIADTTALDAYSEFGEGRWGALVKKPLVVFTGNIIASVGSATAVSDARPTDRTNAQLVSPGSEDFPCVVAAGQLAQIAVRANNNPPHGYGGLRCLGLTPGPDGEQWLYVDRDLAVKAGSSTVEVKNGEVCIGDVVTFYHPENDPDPAYRFVCDIVKLQNAIFNYDLLFASPGWADAPLIPDEQPTVNRTAKKPRMARAEMAAVSDSLALNAIISDPEYTKANMLAGISSTNAKRLDCMVPVKVSGNTNIISLDLNFGFHYGTQEIVA